VPSVGVILLQKIQQRKGLLIKAYESISAPTGKFADAFSEYIFCHVSNQQLQVGAVQTIGVGPVVRFIE